MEGTTATPAATTTTARADVAADEPATTGGAGTLGAAGARRPGVVAGALAAAGLATERAARHPAGPAPIAGALAASDLAASDLAASGRAAPDLAAAAAGPVDDPAGGRAGRRGAAPWAGLAAVATVLSVGLWVHVWGGHPAGTLTCGCGDPAQSVWFIAWVAHALAHGQDPLLSTAVAHPGGINLLANQSSVLVGLALAPLTWAAGPVVTLNVALTLTPVANTLGAAVLCRRVAGWPASTAGALLFGFSPFVLSELAYAHLADALLVFVPLILAALHELLVRRRWPPVRAGLALAGAVVGQFFVSAEVLAVTAVALAATGVVLVAGWGVARLVGRGRHRSAGRRATWRRPALPAGPVTGLAVAAGAAGALLAGPVWLALAGPRHFSGAVWEGASDFGAPWPTFFAPGRPSPAAVAFAHFTGYPGTPLPAGSLLGWGLLAVLAMGVAAARRRPAMWVAATATVTTGILALGSMLLPFDTYSGAWLPWRLVEGLPVAESIVPQRMLAACTLAAGVALAVTLDAVGRPPAGRRSVRRAAAGRIAAAGTLALLALVPLAAAEPVPMAASPVRVPGWFRSVAPGLPPGTVLLTLPFPAGRVADPMAWQALAGFSFTMAGAYAKVPGPDGTVDYGGAPGTASWMLSQLTEPTGPLPGATPAAVATVRGALARWGVTEVVATPRVSSAGYPARYAVAFMTAVLGRAPRPQAGAWVWSGLGALPAAVTADTGTLWACAERPGPPGDAVAGCVLAG